MSRCRISNPKKIKQLQSIVGRPIRFACTRGNTEHRVDVSCCDGTKWCVYPKRNTTEVDKEE